MIEWFDTAPRVAVEDTEYLRLLGFPARHPVNDRCRGLMAAARDWFAAQGRPWIWAREIGPLTFHAGHLAIKAARFASRELHDRFAHAGADRAVIVLVSAGGEPDARTRELWLEEKPDEYFFLEIYASAVAEQLVTLAGARLCESAERAGGAVLPHYSPGYTGWDVADQVRLFHLAQDSGYPLPRDLSILESGMLQPRKSLLALFGLTSNTDFARTREDLIPCTACAFSPCAFRRAPYQEARVLFEDVRRLQPAPPAPATPAAPLPLDPRYTLSPRVLEKWAHDRLSLTFGEEGQVEARFRYDGTTCTNQGWPLQFDYHIRLGPAATGFRIVEARCLPAPEDTGRDRMCASIREGTAFLSQIASDNPLTGQPLEAILGWKRPSNPAGCFCDDSSRLHKWGLVLEVLHFALTRARKA